MTDLITVVVLHHKYSDPQEYTAMFEPLVAGLPVRLVLPHGVPSDRGGYTWFPPGYSTSAEEQVRVLATESDRLAESIRQYGTVIVTGASQGGDLSFALVLQQGFVT